MECVNLKKVFGDRFKIARDESYFAEHGENARADDPWLQIIPCQHGHIYPYGGDMLVASTAKRGGVARELIRLDGATVYRDGDDGVDVLFHMDNFEVVSQLMKPRRRRRLSPQQRQRLAALGRKNLERLRQVNVQTPFEAPERSIVVLAEPTAV